MDDQVADPPGDGAGGEYQPDNQQGLYADSVLPASTPGDQDATPYYERKCLDASCAKSPGESDAVEEVPPSGMVRVRPRPLMQRRIFLKIARHPLPC